jgi:phosphoenolpyruvate carboxykinase (ATP)
MASYHFLSGFTSKVAGTEVGIDEPRPTFSACFGEPFMPLHASRYATMLAERLTWHETDCWLVNTGWSGGPYGTGHRMSIDLTRALLGAALDGSLAKSGFTPHPIFKVLVPRQSSVAGADVLDPRATWADKDAYDATARTLAEMFRENFKQYEEHVSAEVIAAGPDQARDLISAKTTGLKTGRRLDVAEGFHRAGLGSSVRLRAVIQVMTMPPSSPPQR